MEIIHFCKLIEYLKQLDLKELENIKKYLSSFIYLEWIKKRYIKPSNYEKFKEKYNKL